MEGQIKCFPDMVNLKEFVTIKPLLQEMLKGLIEEEKEEEVEEEEDQNHEH